ncbi:MAG: DUF3800 domain-containing protein [Candidatus Microsaccharimonas sp.]
MTTTQLPTINVYSDESRHLKNQGPYMVIGSIWCYSDYVDTVRDKIALVKRKHGIPPRREIKWTKVSNAKQQYYQDLIQLFFDDDNLNFRAIVVPTDQLRHDLFNQSPDEFYYKMQFSMLTNIIRKREANFKIYLDYKDTWSYVKSQKLIAYLKRTTDFANRTFSAQPVRSYESSLLQLADLLIGAVAAKNGGRLSTGTAKNALIALIEENALQKLDMQTPYGVDKFNIFKWRPHEPQQEDE